jgi:peptidoglycan/LPS O-acetylase OafA/YrhL
MAKNSAMVEWVFWQFVKVRVIRLYPLIVLGTLFGTVSMFGHVHNIQATGKIDPHITATYTALLLSLPMGLLLLPFGPLGISIMPLDIPLWSLFFELIANFVYAGIVRFLTPSMLGIVIALSAVIFIAQALIYGKLDSGLLDTRFFLGFARVFASFFIGVALFRLYRRGIFDWLPGVSGLVLGGLLLASFFVPVFKGDIIYCLASIFVIYPLIIVCGLSDVVAARWRPAVAMAGRLSYPVYALHKPFIDHLTKLHRFHGAARVGELAGIIGIVCVIGYVATVLYDEPVRRWLGARMRRTNAPVASLAVTSD